MAGWVPVPRPVLRRWMLPVPGKKLFAGTRQRAITIYSTRQVARPGAASCSLRYAQVYFILEKMMNSDFSQFFEKYEKLAAEIDKLVERVAAEHGECITCTKGCSDCCHAMFDLTLVEAMYLNKQFNELFAGQVRSDLLEVSDEADRKGYRIKRDAFRMSREGARTTEILDFIAKARLRCPLLGQDDLCQLYEHRPLTCRLYGIPTAIRGAAHTCGKSGFKEGVQYPTVQIEKLQDRLLALSAELTASLHSRFARLAEALVPVSMALMNNYNDEYLGIMSDEEWEKTERLRKSLIDFAAEARESAPAPNAAEPGGVAAQTFEGADKPSACASCNENQGSDACSTCGSLAWEIGGDTK